MTATIDINPGVAILIIICLAIWVYFQVDERD